VETKSSDCPITKYAMLDGTDAPHPAFVEQYTEDDSTNEVSFEVVAVLRDVLDTYEFYI